jgi:membrane-associated protease RseP (regulator of RpoE activity)
MANGLKAAPLYQHMAHLVGLEAGIEKSLEPLFDHRQPEVAALARELHGMASVQRQAVAARLQEIAGDGVVENEFEDPLQSAQQAILAALAGYAKMQVLARRFGHAHVTGEGETDKITMRHSTNYINALHGIDQVLHDNVVRALDADGLSCQCPCPACSSGVCLCAVSSRLTQSKARADATPAGEAGIFVHSPSPGSAAAAAGLQHGDIILAADGREVNAPPNLNEVIKGHQSGESVTLRIRRGPDVLDDIEVVRP